MDVIAEFVKAEPLIDALSLFGSIAKNVELRFEPEVFIMIASHNSPRFVATLQISRFSLSIYFIDDTVQIPGLQVLIDSFYDLLIRYAHVSTTLSMHLMLKSQKIALRFHEPPETDLRPKVLQLDYLLANKGGEDLGIDNSGNYFKILSSELRRIIKQLPLFQHHSVCVTVTNSEVKFSVGSEEIVVTKESGICQIEGFGVETELQIVFVPMLFFIDLTYKSTWIWFSKKLNSNCMIIIPLHDDEAKQHYVIHFPRM